MWQWALSQSIGGRQEQQDRVGGFTTTAPSGRLLLVVADGVGGHRHGAMAAELVLDTARTAWEQTDPPSVANEQWLIKCLTEAALRIAALDTKLGGAPRSTATLLFIEGSTGSWCHIGDTRLYHWNGKTLHLRTRDDSVARMLVDMGELTESELPKHPDRNLLTRTLGEELEPKLRTGKIDFSSDDGVVLCSDGLWEHVTLSEMATALVTPKLQTAADHLVKLATQRAGANGDNVSVILARKISNIEIAVAI